MAVPAADGVTGRLGPAGTFTGFTASPGATGRRTRMFTGIVEDLGEVEAIKHEGDFARIYIRSATVTEDARIGDSIAVNGVCLTVTSLLLPGGRPPGIPPRTEGLPDPPYLPRGFAADVMGETLNRSSLKDIAPGAKVNLERSVRLNDRLGGHLVQGHVDGTGTIISRDPHEPHARNARPSTGHVPEGTGGRPPGGDWEVVRVGFPAALAKYVAEKGSIAVDGISLTVSAISDSWFEVSLIPETLKRTTLGAKQPGEAVNLEVDVIAKYVEKLLGGNR
jgi:riboflavin synthase